MASTYALKCRVSVTWTFLNFSLFPNEGGVRCNKRNAAEQLIHINVYLKRILPSCTRWATSSEAFDSVPLSCLQVEMKQLSVAFDKHNDMHVIVQAESSLNAYYIDR